MYGKHWPTLTIPAKSKRFLRLEQKLGHTRKIRTKQTPLLQTFFPPQPAPQGGQEVDETAIEAEVTDPIGSRLLEEEVERAIFSSNPRKAPGPDNLSFRVWQELWPVVKHWIVHIYRRSIQLGYLPIH